MEFISLGRHCDVAYNIAKYIKKEQTHFFDWLRTDFKCILHILYSNNIVTIFNLENIKVDKKLYAHENEIAITLKNFEENNLTLLFHHEIRLKDYNNYNDTEINNKLNEFIEKYKRRFNRLIQLIKSNNKLIFIYKVTNYFDYKIYTSEFEKAILAINPNCIFSLVILVDVRDKDYFYIKYKNYLKINIAKYIDKNIKPDWNSPQIKWTEVFNIINILAF